MINDLPPEVSVPSYFPRRSSIIIEALNALPSQNIGFFHVDSFLGGIVSISMKPFFFFLLKNC